MCERLTPAFESRRTGAGYPIIRKSKSLQQRSSLEIFTFDCRRATSITANPPSSSAADAGSGIAGALIVPLPDVVNPVVVPTVEPENDPVAPANSPVPPVKVNICVKGPTPIAVLETSSNSFPDRVLPSANVTLTVPSSSPVVKSTTEWSSYVTGFPTALRAGLPERTEPVAWP